MGWLGWTLLFVFLVLAAAGLFVFVGLRLWRRVKALGRDLERASQLVSDLGSAADRGPHR
jgi:Flp pilus assembly protein TadB